MCDIQTLYRVKDKRNTYCRRNPGHTFNLLEPQGRYLTLAPWQTHKIGRRGLGRNSRLEISRNTYTCTYSHSVHRSPNNLPLGSSFFLVVVSPRLTSVPVIQFSPGIPPTPMPTSRYPPSFPSLRKETLQCVWISPEKSPNPHTAPTSSVTG